MKTNWDYPELAPNYDMRADYAKSIANFIRDIATQNL